MQVQKGNVEYAGRNDIVITYGQLENGKQYYFIDGGDLGNGNYIATTTLLEAISSKTEPKNLGVINSEGEEVIPFEHKSIKIINDKYLLVVLTTPISQSVIDVALEKEKVKSSVDSLTTSGLITTATAIKESVGTKMALDNGKFIFNDQASEATIYDYEGNNVLNGEYYSFIGLGDTGFYLSKNVVNSPVEKFDFAGKKDNVQEGTIEETVPVEVSEDISTEVQTEPEEQVEEMKIEDSEISIPAEETSEVENIEAEEVNTTVEEQKVETASEDDLDIANVSVDATKIDEALNSEESEDVVEEAPVEQVEETQEVSEDISTEVQTEPEEDSDELNIADSMPIADDNMNKEEDVMKEQFDSKFKLNVDDYTPEESNYSDVVESKYSDDNLYNYSDTYYEEPVSRGDSILPTAISTMNNLIRQNKDQKEKIEVLDNRNNSLKDKISSYENIVSKLENKNQLLESQTRQMEDKIHGQSEIIEKQNREIVNLREKLENQRRSEADLANLLRTAQGVLTDNSYGYSDDEYTTYQRVA